MICIWCRQGFDRLSIEHGIPEALGCPDGLVLRDVICKSCNNTLGTVDQALLKQFEMATVVYGVPRKKGRRPTIDSWRSISSKHRADGPQISLNAGPGIVEENGKRLHPAAKSNGICDVWMEREAGRMGFTQEFGNDPRFVPALYKIGLNLVATAQQRPPIRVTTIFAHLCEASLPRQNFELRWIADRALDRLLLRLIQL